MMSNTSLAYDLFVFLAPDNGQFMAINRPQRCTRQTLMTQGRDLLRLRQVHSGDIKIYSVSLTVLCHVGDRPITRHQSHWAVLPENSSNIDDEMCRILVTAYCLLMIITVVIRVITTVSATLWFDRPPEAVCSC